MWQAIAVIISAGSLAATGIAAWVNSSRQTALNKQASYFQGKKIDELERRLEVAKESMEKRMDDLEHDIVAKLDVMQRGIHQIEINIAKLVKS